MNRNPSNEVRVVLNQSPVSGRQSNRLIKENAAIKSVFDNLPEIVYWKDKNGVYLGINNVLLSRQGLPPLLPGDVIGKTDYDLFPKEIADAYRANDQKVITAGKEIIIEEMAFAPDGKRIFQLSSKKPLRDEQGKVVGVIGVTIDITARKEMEEALKLARQEAEQAKLEAESANKLKSEFIRNLEHDIRVPFCGISNMAQALCHTEKDPDRKESLGLIQESAQQLLNYCNEVLECSRAELMALPVVEKKFNLKAMIENTIKLQGPAVADKKLMLELDYSETVPKIIISDQFRLSRILLNLVSNAVKFTDKGGIKIRVSLVSVADRKAVLEMRIQDTGIGIPEDYQEFVYQKFIRVIPSSKNLYPGAGLGLFLVKQFVNELDADISFKSQEGVGTTFAVTFTVKLPLNEELL